MKKAHFSVSPFIYIFIQISKLTSLVIYDDGVCERFASLSLQSKG